MTQAWQRTTSLRKRDTGVWHASHDGKQNVQIKHLNITFRAICCFVSTFQYEQTDRRYTVCNRETDGQKTDYKEKNKTYSFDKSWQIERILRLFTVWRLYRNSNVIKIPFIDSSLQNTVLTRCQTYL